MRISFNYRMLSAAAILLVIPTLLAQQTEQNIDLASVLELAGARNLTVQEQRALQHAAEADLAKANEWWLPEINVGTSVHYLNGTAMNADGRFFTDATQRNFSAGGGVQATWDLRNGPADVKAARTRAAARELMSKQERNEALLEVVETYYTVAVADAEARAMDRLALLADSVQMQLSVLVDAGTAYTSDLLLARSNVAQLRIRVQRALSSRAMGSARLAALLDLAPGTRFNITETVLAPIELHVQNNASDSLIAIRPDLRAMQLEMDALSAERSRTTTGLLLPQLRVGAGYNAFGDVFQPLWPTSNVNGALVWRLPLGRVFQAGDLKQADARMEIQQFSLRKAIANANAEVQTAEQEVTLTGERLEFARSGAADADEAFAQTMARQRLGLVRPMETLQAQEAAADLLVERIRATAALNVAQYRLRVARGGGL